MITNAIFSFFNFILESIFSIVSFPFVGNLEVPQESFNALKKILVNLDYILPMNHFLIMISFSGSIILFKAIWSLVLRFKSFIPTMGR